MIRKILAVFAALALVVGLAPAAHAQSGSARIGNFDFNISVNAGQSDLRPGGIVRFDLTARNHDSGFPWTPSVLNTYGVTMPAGFVGVGGGGSDMGSIGDHDQPNYWGGQPSLTSRPVGQGSSRSGYLTVRIPEDAQGGSTHTFGLRVNLETFQNWQPTRENVISITLPAVSTRTTVSADPATLQEGTTTTLTADVSAVHGTNGVTAGDIEFEVDGVSIGSAPVGANGSASVPYTAPLLDSRESLTQTIRARYSGDAPRFSGSTSTTTIQVDPEPKSEVTSTVGLTATRGLAENGQLPVTLDVEIDTGDGLDLPEGAEVEILRNGVVVDTVPVTGVTASYTDTLDDSTVATYTYTARLLEVETYDTIYRGATSDPVEVEIAPENTPAVTVDVDPATVLIGRPVDITATITADGDPLPAGTELIIRANGRDIGTVTTDADGTAVLAGHEFDTPGEKNIVAVYEGDEIDGVTYRTATSLPATLTVESLPEVDTGTTIELQTVATAGDEVTITAVVSRLDGRDLTEAGADDLGSVWFFRDGDAIGSAPVVIDPVTGEATAVFTHRFAERGEFRITAEYSGPAGPDEAGAPPENDRPTGLTDTPNQK